MIALRNPANLNCHSTLKNKKGIKKIDKKAEKAFSFLFLSFLRNYVDITSTSLENQVKYIFELFIYSSNRLIGLVGRVFANGPEDLGSIPDLVIPKTLKMVLDTFLLNTQQYKVRIKGKVEQARERSSALPYTLVL